MILCTQKDCHKPASVRVMHKEHPFGRAVCPEHVDSQKIVLTLPKHEEDR